MHRSTWALAAVVMVTLASVGLTKPVRDRPSPAITLANAAKVVKIAELPRDIMEFAWVSGETAIAVLSWESSIDVLYPDTFKLKRTLGAGSRLIHFAFRPHAERSFAFRGDGDTERGRRGVVGRMIVDAQNPLVRASYPKVLKPVNATVAGL